MNGNNINFYDLNKRDKIKSLSGFESFYSNTGRKFCKANDELLLVCGSDNLFLVDLQAYQLISKIECNSIKTLYKLSNNYVLSGQYNGDIKQWKCNGREVTLYSYKKDAHNSVNIMSMFSLRNYFISADNLGAIKIWK